jgi:alpha-beta hydrolase superfamily lysophospholipase
MRRSRWLKAVVYIGSLLFLLMDLLFVVFLTEGALHPNKVQRIIAGRGAANSLVMMRDVPGSLDHLRIGGYYSFGWEYFAAHVSIAASDGTRLSGIWEFPRRGASKAVILCHGFGESSYDRSAYSSLLLGNGFAVLRPDSRGHGGSGGINTFGIREAGDIVQWIRAIKYFSPISKIYGLGESLGGAILLQSLERGADFRAVVAESPFASFFEVANDELRDEVGLVLGPLLVRQSLLYARLIHQVDLNDAQPARAVAHSRVPILLIQGEMDGVTQPEHSREIVRANPAIELWVVPLAQHTLAYSVDPAEFGNRVVAWFDR